MKWKRVLGGYEERLLLQRLNDVEVEVKSELVEGDK